MLVKLAILSIFQCTLSCVLSYIVSVSPPGPLLGQMQAPRELKALTSRSERVLEQRALTTQGDWLKQVCWTPP